MYSSQLNFDINTKMFDASPFVTGKFLDFWIHASFMCLDFSPSIENELAILIGDVHLRTKQRFILHSGDASFVKDRLHQDLQGRLARARQLGMKPFDACYFFLCIFVEMLLLGHPFHFIRGAWHRTNLHDSMFSHGVFALRLAGRIDLRRPGARFADMALEVARAHSDPSCPTTQVAIQLVAPRASQALQAHANTILDEAIREVTANLVRIWLSLFVQWRSMFLQ